MDKELKNNLTIKLNNIGFEFKQKNLGHCASDIIDSACSYFCRYYCRYDKICSTVDDEKLPWCPMDELR